MKKYIFILALAIGLFSTNSISAQTRVRVNISSQPAWGPSGYNYARYYFIPEINMYYDIASQVYIYFNGKYWIKRKSLPSRYRNYDLYSSYKIVINTKSPWYNHNHYKKQYAKYRNIHGKQTPLRDTRKNGNTKGNNHLSKGNSAHSNNNSHSNSNSNHKNSSRSNSNSSSKQGNTHTNSKNQNSQDQSDKR